MMNIANGRANDVMASPHILRLESQLKIKKSNVQTMAQTCYGLGKFKI